MAAQAGSSPGQIDRLEALYTTHRSCRFYLTWFFQTFECGESGWVRVRTPDGSGIMHQDAFFILATDALGREFNTQRAHELWKAQNAGG